MSCIREGFEEWGGRFGGPLSPSPPITVKSNFVHTITQRHQVFQGFPDAVLGTCDTVLRSISDNARRGKFQVMPEDCRKISRYAGQEFHLMTESSA